MYTSRIEWEPLRSVDASTFDGVTYFPVGDPFENPSYICKLVNNSTVLVTISLDGVTDVDVAPLGSFWLYDEGKGAQASNIALPAGTQIYVRGTAGTGLVYLVTQYILQA
jgi:hypothetical protein